MTQRAYGLNFYIQPDGTVCAWQGMNDCSSDPVVASLGVAVYANPALLHHASPSSGDPTLYALQLEYGFCWDGVSYYEGYKVTGARWFLGSTPAAMLPIVPFSAPAFSGHAATPEIPAVPATPAVTAVPALVSGYWGRASAPVLVKGDAGAWDGGAIYNPRIVKRLDGSPYQDGDGFYYLTYAGSAIATLNQDASGLATALDLNAAWTKVSIDGPILPRGAAGSIDAGDCQIECVLFDGSLFHVWYSANRATGSGDQVSIAYATGSSLLDLTKQGVVVESVTGEDYYAASVFANGDVFGMLCVRHVGAVFGVVRLDSSTLGGPWTERAGFVFTHAGSAFLSSALPDATGLRILYSPELSTINSAYARTGEAFVDMGVLLQGGALWDASGIYDGDTVRDGAVEHLFYTGNTLAPVSGIGHAFAPLI